MGRWPGPPGDRDQERPALLRRHRDPGGGATSAARPAPAGDRHLVRPSGPAPASHAG